MTSLAPCLNLQVNWQDLIPLCTGWQPNLPLSCPFKPIVLAVDDAVDDAVVVVVDDDAVVINFKLAPLLSFRNTKQFTMGKCQPFQSFGEEDVWLLSAQLDFLFS